MSKMCTVGEERIAQSRDGRLVSALSRFGEGGGGAALQWSKVGAGHRRLDQIGAQAAIVRRLCRNNDGIRLGLDTRLHVWNVSWSLGCVETRSGGIARGWSLYIVLDQGPRRRAIRTAYFFPQQYGRCTLSFMCSG